MGVRANASGEEHLQPAARGGHGRLEAPLPRPRVVALHHSKIQVDVLVVGVLRRPPASKHIQAVPTGDSGVVSPAEGKVGVVFPRLCVWVVALDTSVARVIQSGISPNNWSCTTNNEELVVQSCGSQETPRKREHRFSYPQRSSGIGAERMHRGEGIHFFSPTNDENSTIQTDRPERRSWGKHMLPNRPLLPRHIKFVHKGLLYLITAPTYSIHVWACELKVIFGACLVAGSPLFLYTFQCDLGALHSVQAFSPSPPSKQSLYTGHTAD